MQTTKDTQDYTHTKTDIGYLSYESPPLLAAFFLLFLGGYPSLQNVVQVTINMVDVNDNSPVIIPSSYVASVRENLPSGRSVLRVGSTLRFKDVRCNGNQLIMKTIQLAAIIAHFS